MARVLLFGYGALPGEGGRSVAPAMRTWHFARVLLDAGHDVCLFVRRMGAPDAGNNDTQVASVDGRLALHRLPWGAPPALVRRTAREWGGECAIGICMAGASLAAQVIGDLPL